jgi:hypothetical protein
VEARMTEQPAMDERTRSTSASPTRRGAPGRGSSSKPSSRRNRKRLRHLPTVGLLKFHCRATAVLLSPLAQASAMRARGAKACADFGRRAQFRKVSCSSRLNDNGGIGLPNGIGTSLYIRRRETRNIFNELMTQDTRLPTTTKHQISELMNPIDERLGLIRARITDEDQFHSIAPKGLRPKLVLRLIHY